jgi:hypothetical protein
MLTQVQPQYSKPVTTSTSLDMNRGYLHIPPTFTNYGIFPFPRGKGNIVPVCAMNANGGVEV